MSAGGAGAIGPVSVRYAAQIRELLFAQALQRMAADQEAARAREQAAAKPEPEHAPLQSKDVTPEPSLARSNSDPHQPAPLPTPETPRLLDIQA
jgi:hypothetical protein